MAMDIFGDLTCWGEVLLTIGKLESEQLLDEHQLGLARILRYKANWRLTERVLMAIPTLTQPSDALITEVLGVAVSVEQTMDNRVLALRALGHLMPRRVERSSPVALDQERIRVTLGHLAEGPHAPLIRRAARDTLEHIAGR